MKHIQQISTEIWWAYVTRQTKVGVEFEGDVFQGQNAEQLARDWFDARPEPAA